MALTGAVLVGGSLAPRLGRRRTATIGLALTVAGSLLGWFAGSATPALQAARAVGGAGAGLVMTATLALIVATAPDAATRTRAIALWAAANVVGLGVGPFLAAAAVGTNDAARAWRWMFVPIAALAALVAVLGWRFAREATTETTQRADRLGQVLGPLSALAIVYAVIHGGARGWTSPGTALAAGVGALLLAGMVAVEHRAEDPVLPLDLFASRDFVDAALAVATALFTVLGVVFVLGVSLAQVHTAPLGIAERIGSLFVGNALASAAAGRLQGRFGPRRVLLGGFALATVGLVVLLPIDLTATGSVDLGWRLLLVGAGCGTVVATSTALAIAGVPGALAGAAGTANNVLRQLGAALGTAVIGGVLATRTADGGGLGDAVRTCVSVLIGLVALTALLSSRLTRTDP